MGLPAAMLEDGLAQRLSLVHDALKRRLSRSGDFRLRTTLAYHDGEPSSDTIPKGDGVWLRLDSFRFVPEDSTFNAEAYTATWIIDVVFDDDGNDKAGFDQAKVFRVMGDVATLLRETLDDVGLDGSVDYQDGLSGRHTIGSISGGDRTVGHIRLIVETALPLIFCRQP